MLRLRDPWLGKDHPGHPAFRFVKRLRRNGTATVYLAERVEGFLAGWQWIVKSYPRVDAPDLLRDQPLIEFLAAEGARVESCVSAGDYSGYWLLSFNRTATFRPIVELLRRGPLDLFQLACIIEGIAAELAELHARHVAHRSLSPTTIGYRIHEFSRTVDVHISDFSCAKFVAGKHASLVAHPSGGETVYSAPEQRAGAVSETPADIYALGRLAYELRTGCHGRRERDEWHRGTPAPAKSWPGMPRRLAEVLRASLSIWPTARPTAMEVYAAALGARLGCYRDSDEPIISVKPIEVL